VVSAVVTMRDQCATTTIDLLREDPRVALVLAEISTDRFARALEEFPDRAVNVGIMEATMVGVAAGLAMEGFHPILHTIAPFLTERPFEQLKLDLGYQGLGGTLLGTGASYDYATEGATHHGTGDVGVLLTIPGVEVLVPGHSTELDALLRATYANGRLTYVRGGAAANDAALPVAPGSLHVLRRGGGPTLVAVGPMLDRTVAAAEGMDATIVYTASVAPFDLEGLASIAGERPHVITVEPFYEGTLAATMTAALRHAPARFDTIGVPRRFASAYGTAVEHDRDNGLDAGGIRARLEVLLA
jgi:transketolase